QTGALVKIAAPSSNHHNNGRAFLGWGGFLRVCASEVVGPDNGYLCAFFMRDGGAAAAYYYIPTTGEFRYLGSYFVTGSDGASGWGPNIIAYPTSSRVIYFGTTDRSGKQLILKGTY